MNRRIAILGPSHPWRGGIAHYTASLYQRLREEGHDVVVYNFRALYPERLFPGKSQIDTSASPFSVPSESIYHPLNPTSWARLIRRLRADRIDELVVKWWHPYFAPGYASVIAAARLLGIKTTLFCHNVEPHEASPVDRALLHLIYATPDAFIVQSSQEESKLRRIIGKTRPIEIVPHPPYEIFRKAGDLLGREEARRRWGVKAKHCILFFGLVRPYKGLDLLLEAAAHLADDDGWEILVVGEFYDPLEKYEAQRAKLGLEDRVRFEDRYVANEEIPALFAAADVCVLPYRNATGSGIANIARAFELPLVMSDLPGLREAFADYEKVRWFEVGDATRLAEELSAASF